MDKLGHTIPAQPIEPKKHAHGLTLRFSNDDKPILLKSTLTASLLRDEEGKQIITALTARCGHDYRWSQGVRAFSVLTLEQLLWYLSPDTDLQAAHQWRRTLYNILRQDSVMSSTRWIVAICGYQGNGRSYLGRLFINKGSIKYPSPVWNSQTLCQSSIRVFRGEEEITYSFDELVFLFRLLSQYRVNSEAIDEAKREAILCSSSCL